MTKRLCIVLVIALLAVSVFGCSSTQEKKNDNQVAGTGEVTVEKTTGKTEAETGSTEPAKDKVFRYAFLDEPPGIDPGISQGGTQSTIYAALFEGLVTVDEEGNIVPGVAKSWDVNGDKTEYTFHLRDGLKWSDGKPLTAKDFEYSWLRVLNPETASTYSWFVEMFIKNGTAYNKGEVDASQVGVKAVDEKTLVVTLNMPASYFLQALLAGCWLPVRQDVVEADPEKWCFNADTFISNGPFKFTEYKIGSHISAVKNEHYWNAENVKLDGVRFNFITDPNTALSAFEAGDVDGIAGVPETEFVNLVSGSNEIHVYDKLSFNFLRLNTTTPGLDNVKVRRAINLAFDRKAYLDGLGNITSTPALGSVPSSLTLAGKGFRDVAGDNGLSATAKLEEARSLLAEAGYPDGKGLPTYRLHCAQSAVKSAEIVQQMLLSNLGIKTEIKPVDSKLNFPMMVEGQYDIAFGGWGGDYTHPMTFLELFTSTAYDNCTRWANKEYDTLIEQARFETDEAKALDLMVQAEHILMEESPIVPLLFPSGAVMIKDYVDGWFISASSVLYLKNASISQ